MALPPSAFAQTGNAVLKRCADEGTTYDKTKCRQANVGKTFTFRGKVFDIKDASTLTLQITTGNYADVVFSSNVGDRTKKDQVLLFKGRLVRIGTGIVVNHDIDQAYLVDEAAEVAARPRLDKDCKAAYQAWIFNKILEDVCGFKRGVAERVGVVAAGVCKGITADQQTEYMQPVMDAVKEDGEKMSGSAFCSQNKAGYEALAK